MTSSNGTFSAFLALARGTHRSPVNSPHKGQWRGALMFCAWINDWVNNREAGDLRHHRAHYDVIVMIPSLFVLPVYPPYPYQVCFPWYPVSGLYPDPSNCSVYWKCDFRVDSNFPQAAISPDQQLPHDIFPPGIPFECPRGQWFDRDLEYCNDIRDVHNCVTWSLSPGQTYEEAIEIPTIEHEASDDVDPFGGSGYLFYPPLH